MDWKNVLLLIVGGVNIGFAALIYLMNPKNKIHIFYTLFVFWIAVWSFGLASFRSMSSSYYIEWVVYGYYAAAACIGFFFYIFSHYFPYQRTVFSFKKITLSIIGLLVLLTSSLPVFLIHSVEINQPDNIMKWNFIPYLVYGATFLIFTFFSFRNLLLKFHEMGGVLRAQLKYVIWGSGITFLFGIFFNLILPFLGNYMLIWLGPVFSVFGIVLLSYLVFFYRHKH